jgi:hypothetical protein|uniref:Uncharacterized protein n=1 Tax=viral metagenome TaxID=1070528 RepID=A0A6C0AHM4_9ZZZZ
MFSDNDKVQLRQMIEKNNVVDKTEQIRELKHSAKIREDIIALIQLKQEYAELLRTDKESFEKISVQKCRFLFFHYMELYNLILKESMDLKILDKLIDVLGRIENNELDQHEGSFLVGTYLKEIYIDGKLAESKRTDELYPSVPRVDPKKIAWSEFKK